MSQMNPSDEQGHPTVGIYDRPKRPAITPLMIGIYVAVLLIGALITYFLFFR